MTEGQVPINFIDNPHAPEAYVTGISGLFLSGGNVAITLESARIDHGTDPGPLNRVVIGRLILTPAAAQGLAVGLNAFLERHGMSPSEAIKGDQSTN